jgi:hypothetical protein
MKYLLLIPIVSCHNNIKIKRGPETRFMCPVLGEQRREEGSLGT